MRQSATKNKKELLGKFKADVISVEDPEGRERIRVTCPKVTNSNTPLAWCESCLPPGMHSLPQPGDKVWIEFEEGEIDKPVWTGIVCTRDYITRFESPDVKDIVLVSQGKMHNKAEDDVKVETKGKHDTQATGNVTVTTSGDMTHAATGDLNGNGKNTTFSASKVLTIKDETGAFSP